MIIKKYKNRKYYCLENSKFIDENFIIDTIKRQEEFIIVDEKKEDITIQIILKLFRKELRKKE